MATDEQGAAQVAAEYAEQAATLASTLKSGTYEAVQALALVSITHSLAVLAQNSARA